ncbi:hypothetical protein CDL15_Pgr023589 [Punica granatum]|uniref:Uncharacterized protein n=1 Tax=Punica granatum TaxID=22663 RepID=A0A218W6Y4_PUNGR|nr:hypothetical protein CDL15_Pgr023589 [Punica granatum]PKI44951.1 hypothetical protein CRG98_034646 [Punica granatum]
MAHALNSGSQDVLPSDDEADLTEEDIDGVTTIMMQSQSEQQLQEHMSTLEPKNDVTPIEEEDKEGLVAMTSAQPTLDLSDTEIPPEASFYTLFHNGRC